MVCNSEFVQCKKPFRFLSSWVKHYQFMEVVRGNWKVDFMGDPFSKFHDKLKKVKQALTTWSKEIFGDIFQKVATFEGEGKVSEIQFEINPSSDNRVELNRTNAKLKRCWHLKEEFWKQKASMRFCKETETLSSSMPMSMAKRRS